MSNQKHILIVGGGAGGITLATQLGKKLGKKKKALITLVDCASTHVWKPLLHEVAAGSLNIGLDAVSFREHAAENGYTYQQGSLTDLDRENKQIILGPILSADGKELLATRRISYDYLVIAIGSVSNDFGIPGVEEYSLFLDNTKQAVHIKEILLNKFLRYATLDQLSDKIKIAIIGAGATGVEMSAEMLHSVNQLKGFGYKITKELLDITVVEASPNILPKVEKLEIQQAITKKLNDLGIHVMTNTRVIKVEESSFTTAEDKVIPADLIIWATGVKAPNFLANIGGLETNRLNQILVKGNLQTTLDPNIFAIGDCAGCPQPGDKWVPPRGQTARQMALMTAKNIALLLQGQEAKHEYIFKDLGTLVNLAKFGTVGSLLSYMGGGVIVRGKIARIAYTTLYKMHLIKVHGLCKGLMVLLIRFMNKIAHPRLKLH